MKNLIIFLVLPLILVSFQNCGVGFEPISVSKLDSANEPSNIEQSPDVVDPNPEVVVDPIPEVVVDPVPEEVANDLKVVDFKILETTSTSVIVEWSLNELADGNIEYGESLSYGSVSVKGVLVSGLKYSQMIEDLKPNTNYNFKITVTNAKGDMAESKNFTGKTKAMEMPVVLTSLLAYEATLFNIVRQECTACHSGGKAPMFAVENSLDSHNFLVNNSYVDLAKPENSKIYRKISGNHAGKSKQAPEFLVQIKSWAAKIGQP